MLLTHSGQVASAKPFLRFYCISRDALQLETWFRKLHKWKVKKSWLSVEAKTQIIRQHSLRRSVSNYAACRHCHKNLFRYHLKQKLWSFSSWKKNLFGWSQSTNILEQKLSPQLKMRQWDQALVIKMWERMIKRMDNAEKETERMIERKRDRGRERCWEREWKRDKVFLVREK